MVTQSRTAGDGSPLGYSHVSAGALGRRPEQKWLDVSRRKRLVQEYWGGNLLIGAQDDRLAHRPQRLAQALEVSELCTSPRRPARHASSFVGPSYSSTHQEQHKAHIRPDEKKLWTHTLLQQRTGPCFFAPPDQKRGLLRLCRKVSYLFIFSPRDRCFTVGKQQFSDKYVQAKLVHP
jgi:hypothetical protein